MHIKVYGVVDLCKAVATLSSLPTFVTEKEKELVSSSNLPRYHEMQVFCNKILRCHDIMLVLFVERQGNLSMLCFLLKTNTVKTAVPDDGNTPRSISLVPCLGFPK